MKSLARHSLGVSLESKQVSTSGWQDDRVLMFVEHLQTLLVFEHLQIDIGSISFRLHGQIDRCSGSQGVAGMPNLKLFEWLCAISFQKAKISTLQTLATRMEDGRGTNDSPFWICSGAVFPDHSRSDRAEPDRLPESWPHLCCNELRSRSLSVPGSGFCCAESLSSSFRPNRPVMPRSWLTSCQSKTTGESQKVVNA